MIFDVKSDKVLDLAIKDYIERSKSPIFNFIRKNIYYYPERDIPRPDWLPHYNHHRICISVLNPLNRNILEVYYANDWLLRCNFTENKNTSVLVKAECLTEDAIIAMLPYSGSTYEELDLPF